MSDLAIEICDAIGTQSKFWRIKDGEGILARSATVYDGGADVAKELVRMNIRYAPLLNLIVKHRQSLVI